MFLPPFRWGAGMTKVSLSTKTLYPLLAIPITEDEMQLVRREGSEALEDRWVEADCDTFDWNRKGDA